MMTKLSKKATLSKMFFVIFFKNKLDMICIIILHDMYITRHEAYTQIKKKKKTTIFHIRFTEFSILK